MKTKIFAVPTSRECETVIFIYTVSNFADSVKGSTSLPMSPVSYKLLD